MPASRGCIVCGTDNPIGLRLRFSRTDVGAGAQVRPPVHFQGFDGVLQGGIVSGLMDDAMWYAIFAITQTVTMTAELTVRFRAPIPVETELSVSGRYLQQRRSLFTATANITDVEGKILAEASGKFLTAPQFVVDRLRIALD